MVEEVPYGGPNRLAYQRLEQIAQDDPELSAAGNNHIAELLRGDGFLRIPDNVILARSTEDGYQLEPPCYCVSVYEDDYTEEARELAEEIEEEFDLNVYLFDKS